MHFWLINLLVWVYHHWSETNEGVVLGIEKKLPSSKLMEVSNKSEKLVEIDRHCVCAMSGIVGNARILIDHARVEA